MPWPPGFSGESIVGTELALNRDVVTIFSKIDRKYGFRGDAMFATKQILLGDRFTVAYSRAILGPLLRTKTLTISEPMSSNIAYYGLLYQPKAPPKGDTGARPARSPRAASD